MGSTWDHPQLGQFNYDDMGWTGTVNLPAFQAFSYQTGFGNVGRSKGMHKMSFEAYDETDLPTTAAIELASRVLANQAELAAAVTRALWEDFNGRGPDSGMWWHGDLERVAAWCLDDPPVSPDDLLAVMKLSVITIRKGLNDHDEPVAELSF